MTTASAASKTGSGSGSGSVLMIGATGYIGRFIAEASLDSGKTTYLLVRPGSSSSSPSKAAALKELKSKGAIIVEVITHFLAHVLFVNGAYEN